LLKKKKKKEFAVPISVSERQGNTSTCVDVKAVANRDTCALTDRPLRWSEMNSKFKFDKNKHKEY